jgi:hypothetical protein
MSLDDEASPKSSKTLGDQVLEGSVIRAVDALKQPFALGTFSLERWFLGRVYGLNER